MKIAFFDAKDYDESSFNPLNKGNEIVYIEDNLSLDNAHLAKGCEGVCGFVNTPGNADILKKLKEAGVKFWFQRSMGYNNVDLKTAKELDIKVWRVTNYSAETIGEHALTLLLAANRNLWKALNKTKNNADFSLSGLQGKTIFGSNIGVIGGGKIGQCFIKAAKGMGANISVFDDFLQQHNPSVADEIGFKFVTLDELLKTSDFISIHAPLLPSTKHIINDEAISKMKKGMVLINSARGPLVDTTALIKGLKSGIIKGVGLDVVEREQGRFFLDRSSDIAELKSTDPEWKYLMEADNVIITAHQAFLSDLALNQIAEKTLKNVSDATNNNFEASLQLQEDGKVING